jgi:hypothetical protein
MWALNWFSVQLAVCSFPHCITTGFIVTRRSKISFKNLASDFRLMEADRKLVNEASLHENYDSTYCFSYLCSGETAAERLYL